MDEEAERFISIPTSSGETVVITSAELRDLDQKEVTDLLVSEKAPLSVWHAVMIEYWRLRRVDAFDDLLRRGLLVACEFASGLRRVPSLLVARAPSRCCWSLSFGPPPPNIS